MSRTAIIGAGLMGRWHGWAAKRAGASLIGVVDSDLGRARALARRLGCSAFNDVPALFDSLAPNVVHICTPSLTHRDMAFGLMNRGVHVLCEKPLANTASDVLSLLQLARAKACLFCPVHQFPFQRGFRSLQSRIGRLGEISHLTFRFTSAGGASYVTCRLDEIVDSILPHALSILLRLFPASDWQAATWRVLRAAPGELTAIGARGGMTVSLLVSLTARPTEASMTISGSGGSAYLDFFHGYAFFLGSQVSRQSKIVAPLVRSATQMRAAIGNLAIRAAGAEVAYPGLSFLVAQFYSSVRTNGEPPIHPDEVAATYRLCDRLVAEACATPARRR